MLVVKGVAYLQISAGVLAALMVRALIKPYVISSRSMEPVLRPGERLLAVRARSIFWRPRRSDILVFKDPAQLSTLTAHPPGGARCPSVRHFLSHRRTARERVLIKRVIAQGT